MVTGQYNGNLIETNENGEWVYSEDKTPIEDNPRHCTKCGHMQTKREHDYCIANLPGVKNACCGHGIEEGYISFENGITIRGYFKVENNV